MPSPTGRRHPLFLRFQKPVDPIYPDPVTPVAWDDDEPVEDAEGVVYVASRPSSKLRAWAAQMRVLHSADMSYETEESISRLSARPIMAERLKEIGKWRCDFWNADYSQIKSARRAHYVNAVLTQMAVILDKANGNAVGFVSFDIRWLVGACFEGKERVDLTLEYDQAWIAPAYRYRGWASTAAIAIALSVKRHVDQLAETTRWPGEFAALTKLVAGADIYSTSGERFLQSAAQYLSFQFDFQDGDGRIKVVEMDVESRW